MSFSGDFCHSWNASLVLLQYVFGFIVFFWKNRIEGINKTLGKLKLKQLVNLEVKHWQF